MIIELSYAEINGYIKKHFGLNLQVSMASKERLTFVFDTGSSLGKVSADVDLLLQPNNLLELKAHSSLPGVESILSGAGALIKYKMPSLQWLHINGLIFTIALSQIPQLVPVLNKIAPSSIELSREGIKLSVQIR